MREYICMRVGVRVCLSVHVCLYLSMCLHAKHRIILRSQLVILSYSIKMRECERKCGSHQKFWSLSYLSSCYYIIFTISSFTSSLPQIIITFYSLKSSSYSSFLTSFTRTIEMCLFDVRKFLQDVNAVAVSVSFYRRFVSTTTSTSTVTTNTTTTTTAATTTYHLNMISASMLETITTEMKSHISPDGELVSHFYSA